jgi:hypothetical protein
VNGKLYTIAKVQSDKLSAGPLRSFCAEFRASAGGDAEDAAANNEWR